MSTTYSPLTAGIQHIYKYGLLPSNLSINALKSAATQAARLASASRPVKPAPAQLGTTSDTATLSTAATDSLTQAVSTPPIGLPTALVDKSAPQPAAVSVPATPPGPEESSGSQINLLA